MNFNFKTEDKIELKYYRREINGVNIMYGHDTLNENALKFSVEELQALDEEWKETEKFNRQTISYNNHLANEAVKELERFCKMLGWETYKTSKNGKIIGEYKEFKMLKRQIEGVFGRNEPAKPWICGVKVGEELIKRQFSPCTMVQLVKSVKERLEKVEAMALKEDKLYLKSVELLVNNKIPLEDKNREKIIGEANYIAEQEFLKESYPEGSELEIDSCDYCNEWTIGERRCSCGNRRVSLSVEGDLISGYFAYPEAY